ncbi:MAG: hypothetical protein QM820_05170 [Minicystis sp.]
MRNDDAASGIAAHLDDPSLTPGQRRRIKLFADVEATVCARIEELCVAGGLEVIDTAALVVAPTANDLVFGDDMGKGTSVLLGHRLRLYEFLEAALPKAPDAPFDPYADLLVPSPARCVRVLVLDHESLTVMSYGTFVTVRMDADRRAQA